MCWPKVTKTINQVRRKMQVIIEKYRCNGSGICESICCQVCDHSSEEKEKTIKDIITEDYELACRKAAKYCPAGAISVEQ